MTSPGRYQYETDQQRLSELSKLARDAAAGGQKERAKSDTWQAALECEDR